MRPAPPPSAPFEHPRLPLRCVYLELTNRCNFACEFCPNPVMERAQGLMDLGLLERALDEVAERRIARRALFHQQGEPTLHPRLADAVQLAAARGLAPSVTTNGSTLNDRLVGRLLLARLSRLTISLQTPDEASYRIRGAKNLTFDAFAVRVREAIRQVLTTPGETEVEVALLTNPLGGRVGLPTIGRDWSLIASDRDLHAVLEAWAAPALDGVPGAPSAEARRRAISRASVLRPSTLELGPRLRFVTRPVGEWPSPTTAAPGTWHEAPFGTCHGLSDHFAILWDGRFSYCCVDYDGHTSPARFPETSILGFLGSEPVQRAVRGFARMMPVHPYCKKCLGGPSRAVAWGKALGSIAYFGVYRPLLSREIEA